MFATPARLGEHVLRFLCEKERPCRASRALTNQRAGLRCRPATRPAKSGCKGGLGAALRRTVIASLALCAALAGTATADPLGDTLAQRIPALMARHDVTGLNVLVLRAGREVWDGSFGWADPNSGRPVQRDTAFRLESLSKPVTAWGALRLVEEARIALDAPVTDTLSSWAPPPGTPAITLGQLLSHRGGVGLGDFTARFSPDDPLPDKRAALTRDFSMIAEPGSGVFYSDTGFNLIELVIEDATDRPFADWMGAQVLQPLGMTTAQFNWTPALASRLATGHDLRGRPVAPYLYPGAASGGMLGDIDAVAAFARASFAPPFGGEAPILSQEAIELMHRPAAPVGGLFGLVAEGYGLAHFTETLSDGREAVWHGGQGYGWMTHLHIIPETGDAIILLANSQRAWPLFAEVLTDWSASIGVAPVGMARVALAWWLGLVVTVALALGAAGQALRLGFGIGWGRRGFQRPTPARAVFALGGAGLVGAVIWAVAQDYLFLFSILPGLSGWLGVATAALGMMTVLSAFWAPKSPV